ncbi:MAG: flavodoxin [Candidatus Altiarchaeota archaeon]
MKSLVVYYSRDGSTRKVSEELAKILGSDVEELTDKKGRKGPIGYMMGGKDAAMKKLTDLGSVKYDPSQYDIVVVGTPVWAMTMSPAVRTYLTRMKGKMRKAAFFATYGGSGGDRAVKHMGELSGLKPTATLGLTESEVKSGSYTQKLREFSEDIPGNP